MDPRNLFTMYYKNGASGQVANGLLWASSQDKAEKLGQHYCNSHMGRRYIRVEPALLAFEDDLPIPEEDPKPAPDDEGAVPMARKPPNQVVAPDPAKPGVRVPEPVAAGKK